MGRDPEYREVVRPIFARARARAGLPAVAQEQEQQAYGEQRAPVPPEAVAEVADLRVPGGAGDLPARLYRPTADRGGPCLVFFHGGGFAYEDVESYDPVTRTLARVTGAAVLSVDYRLAFDHPWPAAVEDAYAATRWTLAHAADLGVGRVGVAGDSAGGNLAAVTAQRLRGAGLAVQVLIYPVLDLRMIPPLPPDPDGFLFPTPESEENRRRYVGAADPAHPHVSPLVTDDLSGVAPAVIATAQFDKLCAQAVEYAGRLEAAGVPVAYVDGAGLDHAYLSWTAYAKRPREAVEEIGARVRDLLAAGS
jgi:acetyl esterase